MLVKLAFVMQRLKKYLRKFLSWSTKMGGTFFNLMGGDTAVMRGDIELMGVPPVPPPLEKTLDTLLLCCHDTEMDDYAKDGGLGEVWLLCSIFHEALKFLMQALRSYLILTCEYELLTLWNAKVGAAKDHGENYMKVRPPLVHHLQRNRLLVYIGRKLWPQMITQKVPK